MGRRRETIRLMMPAFGRSLAPIACVMRGNAAPACKPVSRVVRLQRSIEELRDVTRGGSEYEKAIG
ncbi:hypothetical protein XI02_30045 [Bradyrhizobium sp. CCBAU 21365]|nr:hypothetical protein XI02_30045 [Bradyrhizobium sp. CCBAU 21365]